MSLLAPEPCAGRTHAIDLAAEMRAWLPIWTRPAQGSPGMYVFQAGKLGDDDGRHSGSEEKSNEELKNPDRGR